MKKESSDIFDLAFNQWQGNKAVDNDLFDLKLSDMIKIDIVIINNIKKLISKVLERLKNMGNSFNIITIKNNLNRELDIHVPEIQNQKPETFRARKSNGIFRHNFLDN